MSTTPNRAKLTKNYVDRIVPGSTETLYWDTEVKGFGVRVSPRGKVAFIVQGRATGSEAVIRLTIGTYGVFTVDQARDEAREHLRSMRMGIDPRDARKADDAMRVTLQQVCDAYVARPGKLKASSRTCIQRHVRTTFEDWRDKPIASITEEDCRLRYRKMLTKGLRGNGPAPGQANQAFSILGALINYAGRQHRRADGTPIILRNPVVALKDDRVRLKPRTTRILDTKVGACWAALGDWRAVSLNRETQAGIDLIRFLLLTGLRLGEASSLRWEQVNLDEGYFHLPDPKNRNPVFMPMSSQAVALLRQRPHVEGNPHVFASWSKAGHIMDPRETMARLSKVAGTRLTNHDMRRTFTNIALRVCRIEKFRTDLLTNHITRDVTAEHYFDTTNLQWLQPEAQKVGDWIERQGLLVQAGAVDLSQMVRAA